MRVWQARTHPCNRLHTDPSHLTTGLVLFRYTPYYVDDMSINIIIINDENRKNIERKKLKRTLPPELQEALQGLDLDMEDHEEVREKQPKGFPNPFVVPEEVLFFKQAEEEEEESPVVVRNRRRRKNLKRRSA